MSFISEILEKVVADWLQAHIKNIRPSNLLQSVYRKHHSTESALLKVQNDIIIRMDKGEVTALTLISTPLTMLHYLIHFQIGMEYLHMGRVKFGFLLFAK